MVKKHMDKLTYRKFNNSNDAIIIDLHNNYSVMAISGWNIKEHSYTTALFLKENSVDDLKLIEKAAQLKISANSKNVKSAILKKVAILLDEGFFDYYIKRYDYELSCFDKGCELCDAEISGKQ